MQRGKSSYRNIRRCWWGLGYPATRRDVDDVSGEPMWLRLTEVGRGCLIIHREVGRGALPGETIYLRMLGADTSR